MAAASPFVVHVADLLRAPGTSRPLHLEVPVDWSVDFSRSAPDPPLVADLVLTSAVGGVMVRGSLDVTVRHTCVRCLTETEDTVLVELSQLVETADEGDDGYVLRGVELDIEPILRDEVLLAMPLLPRCPGGCAELVDGAESGLNTSTPGERRSDSPFAVLRDLFDPGD